MKATYAVIFLSGVGMAYLSILLALAIVLAMRPDDVKGEQ